MLQSIVDNIPDVVSARFLFYNCDIFTRAILCKRPGCFVALAVNYSPLHEMTIFKPSLEQGPIILDVRALPMQLAADPSPSLLLAGI